MSGISTSMTARRDGFYVQMDQTVQQSGNGLASYGGFNAASTIADGPGAAGVTADDAAGTMTFAARPYLRHVRIRFKCECSTGALQRASGEITPVIDGATEIIERSNDNYIRNSGPAVDRQTIQCSFTLRIPAGDAPVLGFNRQNVGTTGASQMNWNRARFVASFNV